MAEIGGYPVTRNDCVPFVDSVASSSSDYDYRSPSDGLSIGNILAICLIYGMIVLVTILGNFIVIVAFARDPAIRGRVSNLFILNLSVADFLIGAVCMSTNLVWLLTDDWALGRIPCQIYMTVDYIVSYMSVLSIILISLDRYRLVTLHLKYMYVQTRRRALVSISCCWGFCLIFYPAIIIGWSPLTGENNIDFSNNCEVQFTQNLYMNWILILIEFVIPLVILIYLNTKLYLIIRRRAEVFVLKDGVRTISNGVTPPIRKCCHESSSGAYHLEERSPNVSLTSLIYHRRTIPGENENFGASAETKGTLETAALPCRQTTYINNTMGESTVDSPRKQFKEHRKAAITLSLIVGVYAICWLPFCVKNTIVTFCGPVDYYVLEVVDNLLWCNSTINPFLYALLNPKYRRFFARVFRWVCCCL